LTDHQFHLLEKKGKKKKKRKKKNKEEKRISALDSRQSPLEFIGRK